MTDPKRFQVVRLAASQAHQELTVGWADGHTSAFSYEGLRRACPCVNCRGGHGHMSDPIDPMVFALPSLMTYAIEKLQPAGNYGLQIFWDDGHHQGIFRWDYLRELDALIQKN